LQWTDGNASLAVGAGRLEVTLAMCASYWREPAHAPRIALRSIQAT